MASNRQPYRHEYETDGALAVDRPAGGLTAGLDPVLRRSGGTWVAWGDGEADRAVTDDDGCVAVPPESESYTLQRVWLSEEAVDGYYTGYSNRVLWPTCHGLLEYVEDRPGDREWYRRVNRRFADAIADHASEDAVVWLQDYHLGLVPSMVRDRTAEGLTVGHFWHIPWPDPDAFEASPLGTELLEGLLGADVLGFHVDRYGEAFLATVDRVVDAAAVDYEAGIVRHDGGETRVVATPMGVDATAYDRRGRAVDGSRWRAFRDRHDVPADVTIGLGVDRLDYTKGIPERLAAIERLFEREPEWRGAFTFVQKATPSRTEVPAYAEHGERVRAAVERINDRFATDDWRPIVYTEEYLPEEDLCALYRRADTMVVSSLADGMNLVTQEFVAASVDGQGALVLSDRAGAAESLGADAYTIDPTRTDEFAAQLDEALSAPSIERHRRLTRLRSRVFERDLEWWMDCQFAAIDRVRDPADASPIADGGVPAERARDAETERAANPRDR